MATLILKGTVRAVFGQPLPRGAVTTVLGEPRGLPEPRIEVRFPEGTSWRVQCALLHVLAAEVELATPPAQRWIVDLDALEGRGRVFVELATGTRVEAQEAMDVLACITRALEEER